MYTLQSQKSTLGGDTVNFLAGWVEDKGETSQNHVQKCPLTLETGSINIIDLVGRTISQPHEHTLSEIQGMKKRIIE
jgi:hypothetical protein